MARYIIQGGCKLKGNVKISGNKNSILPCICASLLTSETVILENVPQISDVEILTQILVKLGAKITKKDDSLEINCSEVEEQKLPSDLMTKLRASVLLIGPLISKFGSISFPHPGGDVIGRRSISAHLEGFKKLGYLYEGFDSQYEISRESELKEDIEIFLEEASVTATENLILASVLGRYKVVLKNCAGEPHVVDLCNLLNLMGASISGIGSSTLIIQGVNNLKGAKFKIGADYLELGTYAVAAGLTNGEVVLENINIKDLEPITYPLIKMGINFKEVDNRVIVTSGGLRAISKLKVNIWPGFPSDMMSVMIVLATQAKGTSLLHDWMYESRMYFVDKLTFMGADITVADPHRVLVCGPTKLYGRNLETPDIRAGMALVLAALVAQGESVINKAELIERGYEDVVGKLTSLGVNITRLD